MRLNTVKVTVKVKVYVLLQCYEHIVVVNMSECVADRSDSDSKVMRQR